MEETTEPRAFWCGCGKSQKPPVSALECRRQYHRRPLWRGLEWQRVEDLQDGAARLWGLAGRIRYNPSLREHVVVLELEVKAFGVIVNSDGCQCSWNRPIHETAQHHDERRAGSMPKISIRLRSSSTVAPKTRHNLLLDLCQDAVLYSTLFQEFEPSLSI
jgi:hypothetical protein